MDGVSLVVALVIGLLLGLLIGWLLARGRSSAAEARAIAAEERANLLDTQLAERFRELSAQALDATNHRFMELAEGRLKAANATAAGELDRRKQAIEHLVTPLRDTLGRMETQLREADAGRRAAHAELTKHVDLLREGSESLRGQTQALVTALRRPEARGRWGELQLRRVAELAGMAAHCDFEEQVSVGSTNGTQRPDMVVRLAGDKNIVVDSKVSLAAYLEAAESDDPELRTARLADHARHLRKHVDSLAAKSYWSSFSATPEFVVLFIPGEAFLAPALEHDVGLLEYAMGRRVHIATPTTLISLLRTAQYAWQQQALGENAREVFELGKQMYERLTTLGSRVDSLGKALSKAVDTYNQTVGSLESRVLVSARRFKDLGLTDADLAAPAPVESHTRPLAAPELTEPEPAEVSQGAGVTEHDSGNIDEQMRTKLFGTAFPGNSTDPGFNDATRDQDPEIRY